MSQVIPAPILQDKAPSTNKSYISAFHHWSSWPTKMSLPSFPAQLPQVILYIVHPMQSGSGKSSIIQAFVALLWMHVKADQANPSAHPAINQLNETICRSVSQPTNHRVPLSTAQYRRVMEVLNPPPQSLAGKQLADLTAAALLAGLLLWNNL